MPTPQTTFLISEAHIDILSSSLREIGDTAASWSVSSAKQGCGVRELRDKDPETYWQSDGSKLPHSIHITFPRATFVSCVALLVRSQPDDSYTPRKIVVRAAPYVGGEAVQVAEVDTQAPQGWVLLRLTADGSPPPPLSSLRGLQQQYARWTPTQLASLGQYFGAGTRYSRDGRRMLGPNERDDAAAPIVPPRRLDGTAAEGAPVESLSSDAAAPIPPPPRAANATDPAQQDVSVCQGVLTVHLQICIMENHQNGRDSHVRGVRVYSVYPPDLYATTRFDESYSLR